MTTTGPRRARTTSAPPAKWESRARRAQLPLRRARPAPLARSGAWKMVRVSFRVRCAMPEQHCIHIYLLTHYTAVLGSNNSLDSARTLQRLQSWILLVDRRFDLWMHILSHRQVYKWLGLCIMRRLSRRSLQRQIGAEQQDNCMQALSRGTLRRQAWSLLLYRPVPQGIVQQARCDRVHTLPTGEV